MAPKKTIEVPQPPLTHPNLYVGTSGWAYPTWRPDFYPAGLSSRGFLPFYASRLNSVEVNYTFRALPTLAMVEDWLSATPADFRFSFKAPQRITHFNRLLDCGSVLEEFLAALAPVQRAAKLGMILFQLPPNFKADLPRLDTFLSILRPQRLSIAFEFRHESWFQPPTYKLLEKSETALCVAESDDLTTPEVHTASQVACFRLRRNGGYTSSELNVFATRFAVLAATRNIYAYLKHEDEPTGALNATALLSAAAALPQEAA